MTLHNGTVKIIAPEGKAYDVKPNMDPWGAGPTATLEVVVAPNIDAAVTAAAANTSKIDVTFMKDKAKDTTVGGTFSFRILSGDMLGVDDSHEDVVAMGDGNATAGMASIARAKPSQKPAGFGDEKALSEILKAGKTYTLHFMASGVSGGIPAYYDSMRAKFVPGTGGDKPEELPFGDKEISELPDSGATLSAAQNADTGEVTLSIVNSNLENDESVKFFFVEAPELPQSEASARTASRSVSAALTIAKKVKTTDGKTFTATLTKEELAGLKDGATYAIEYINEDGSVLGYSTFTAGGLKFKSNGGETAGGGSSGCDAGFGALALALAVYVTTLRKKIRAYPLALHDGRDQRQMPDDKAI